jgi:hypothetical protein
MPTLPYLPEGKKPNRIHTMAGTANVIHERTCQIPVPMSAASNPKIVMIARRIGNFQICKKELLID